jgi:hypothetical protein
MDSPSPEYSFSEAKPCPPQRIIAYQLQAMQAFTPSGEGTTLPLRDTALNGRNALDSLEEYPIAWIVQQRRGEMIAGHHQCIEQLKYTNCITGRRNNSIALVAIHEADGEDSETACPTFSLSLSI